MPDSPHFSVLKATESWVGPENEAIDIPGVLVCKLFPVLQMSSWLSYSNVEHVDCGLVL